MEKGERCYGKGECYTYDIITIVARQPTEKEGKNIHQQKQMEDLEV
jgi:hypothetical protein